MVPIHIEHSWHVGIASSMVQEIADASDGEDILVVAHWDAVSGSIARLRPWAIADHVIHTGYTVQWRERQEGALAL